MLPFESTTCQCGSGVSGTLKSSDSVSTFLPSFIEWVTVPALTFAPENGLAGVALRQREVGGDGERGDAEEPGVESAANHSVLLKTTVSGLRIVLSNARRLDSVDAGRFQSWRARQAK